MSSNRLEGKMWSCHLPLLSKVTFHEVKSKHVTGWSHTHHKVLGLVKSLSTFFLFYSLSSQFMPFVNSEMRTNTNEGVYSGNNNLKALKN